MVGCILPYWGQIQNLCGLKIKQKFPQYGNSWKECFDDNFWNQRLQGEVNEVKEVSSLDQDRRISELIDVINVCAMQISNLLDSRNKEIIKTRLGV